MRQSTGNFWTLSYYLVPYEVYRMYLFPHKPKDVKGTHKKFNSLSLFLYGLSEWFLKLYCQIRKKQHTPGLDTNKSRKPTFVFPEFQNESLTADTETIHIHQENVSVHKALSSFQAEWMFNLCYVKFPKHLSLEPSSEWFPGASTLHTLMGNTDKLMHSLSICVVLNLIQME